MQRFLMLVGVAVVAAAMYVAASPASQQSSGPTAKQFKALKKQVASLSKTLKVVKAEAADADGFVRACFLSTGGGVLPVNQFGNPAPTDGTPPTGYQFDNGGGNIVKKPALDIDPTPATGFTGAYLQGVDPACVQNSAPHRLGHAGARSSLRAEHTR